MSDNRRYWDTVCFLGWLNEESDKVEACQGVIDAAEKGEIEIVTSAYTLCEVLYLKGHQPIEKEQAAKIKEFFENDYIHVIPVDRVIADMARDVYWDHNVKPKDAVHVATALRAEVSIFDTFDPELIRLNNSIGNPPLIIGVPNIPIQREIEFEEETE